MDAKDKRSKRVKKTIKKRPLGLQLETREPKLLTR